MSKIKQRVGKHFAAFTTLDIVLMAMLATANGAMTFYLSVINKMLNNLGGPIATSTITGLYIVYGLLAYYIIRKPGTAIITYGIGAVVQSFIGSAYGLASIIVAALCYMVVLEVLFFMTRYKKWSASFMMLAGALLVPLWFVFAAQMFGYTSWGWPVLIIALVVRMISGAVLCGWLTKIIGDGLIRSGMLRKYGTSEQFKA
ncbi:ECF transporter S component [Paenibacillus sp. Marseille-Q4541]|uniref:ECF transporter S component n=1 Tax=Paenibacillus sp. Marseille-Q4541 TaxID=2831522 RepID=UPI001BA6AEEC|nr:ECF transporter S component [Paenibacillus sp. Marseille-Q4541]